MLTSPSLPIDSIIFDLALVSANLACYKISFHSEKYSKALRVSYTQVAAPLGFISADAGKQTVHLMFLRWVSSAGAFISSVFFPPPAFSEVAKKAQVRDRFAQRWMCASSEMILYFLCCTQTWEECWSTEAKWLFSPPLLCMRHH